MHDHQPYDINDLSNNEGIQTDFDTSMDGLKQMVTEVIYNPVHDILEFCNVLVQVLFTTRKQN